MTRLEPEFGELGNDCSNRQCGAVVVSLLLSARHQAVLFDSVKHLFADSGRLADVCTRQPDLAAAGSERTGIGQAVLGECEVRHRHCSPDSVGRHNSMIHVFEDLANVTQWPCLLYTSPSPRDRT